MSQATPHYEDTDLAMFAMQLLDAEKHQVTAEHVSECAFCRQELARLQGDLATCAYGVEMHAPNPIVRERVMHRVAREKRVAPPVEEVSSASRIEAAAVTPEEAEEPTLDFRRRRPEGRSARRLRREQDPDERPKKPAGSLGRSIFLSLGWAAAIGLAGVGAKLYQQQMEYKARLGVQAGELTELSGDAVKARRRLKVMTDPSAQHILLSSPETATASLAEGHVIYEADRGSLILLADHLAALDADKTYELWLIPADGRDPVPAGIFRPDEKGNGSVVLPSLSRDLPVKAFGVTVEDRGGSQTPTMPIVLAGS